jgi:hypothetical protein
MRPLREIAAQTWHCATSWEDEAMLIGNVRADEVAELAKTGLELAALRELPGYEPLVAWLGDEETPGNQGFNAALNAILKLLEGK